MITEGKIMKRQLLYFEIILAISMFVITCSPTESDEPQLRVEPGSCTFSRNAISDTLTISNAGSGTLSWEIKEKPVWLEISMISGTLSTGNDMVIATADFDRGAGDYSGTMKITSNGGEKVISLNINAWVKKADMNNARVAHGIAALNGRLFALGGFRMKNNRETRLSSVEVYDPVTDIWTLKSNLLIEKSHFPCCSLNGKLYAIGGWDGSRGITDVEEYDPGTDTWTQKSPLLTDRWGHDIAVVNGKIYAIGGAFVWPVTLFSDYVQSVEEYDPQTDTWTTKSFLPSPRWGLSCSVVDDKIYVIGGCMDDTGLSTVELYDPAANTWTTKTPMPTARFAHFTSAVNGKIYVISGSDFYPTANTLESVEEYDPATDTWTTKSPMPAGRIAAGGSSESIDGKIYIVGGRGLTTDNIYKSVFEYEPGLDISSQQ
jgi:N-acetylneuraminic acid mutarotase